MIPCECPCGQEFEEFDEWGRKRRFIQGHQFKGKSLSDEHKNKLSESKKGEKNPNYGKTFSDITKQKMSESHKGEKNHTYGKSRSNETKQKIREKSIGKIVSKETRQLMSDSQIGRVAWNKGLTKEDTPSLAYSDEHRKKISGENNPNWNGGISKDPYCFEFDVWLKEEIKERDNYHCKNPDCTNEITKNNPLCTHHIDYNKKNCSTNNLVTICRNCNSKANFNRKYWKEFYKSIVGNNFQRKN